MRAGAIPFVFRQADHLPAWLALAWLRVGATLTLPWLCVGSYLCSGRVLRLGSNMVLASLGLGSDLTLLSLRWVCLGSDLPLPCLCLASALALP